jgi:hypothetical protein
MDVEMLRDEKELGEKKTSKTDKATPFYKETPGKKYIKKSSHSRFRAIECRK